jgi:hypothetical protein
MSGDRRAEGGRARCGRAAEVALGEELGLFEELERGRAHVALVEETPVSFT